MAAEDELARRARELLHDCSAMTLATAGADGLWAADVFFAPRGLEELFFLSSPTTVHARNLLASPSVAATIHADVGSDWRSIRGLQLAGSAALVETESLAAARDAYFGKFPFAAALLQPGAEIEAKTSGTQFFVLRVERLYLVDNRLGFGVRHELTLERRA
jgi:uncharacterized protein